MLPKPKVSNSPAKLLPAPPPPQLGPPWQHRRTAGASPSVNRNLKLSRRELSKSSLFLLIGTQTLTPICDISKAQAEEDTSDTDTSANCGDRVPTRKAFLDISIDGEPVGKIIIGLYGDYVPSGAARFSNLVSGKSGISYRRKEFVKIMPGYVQHGGIRSYGADAERASGGLAKFQDLLDEWERTREDRCKNNNGGSKISAGTVGIVVRDPLRPPPKIKLVAKNGKLEIDQEEIGVGPNGTEFVIVSRDSPELEESVLVVGRVLEGIEVVEKMREVKTVRENTGSPYFRVAKLIGDKRAVVAERGFNRPYSKIIVNKCGLIE